MTGFVSSIAFVLFFFLASYGIGRLITHLAHREAVLGWAYTASLGVAGWIFYGGVLNLLHLVHSSVLLSSLIVGAVLALFFIVSGFISSYPSTIAPRGKGTSTLPASVFNVDSAVFALLVIVPLVFCVAYLMPTSAFNFHDDFNSYFYRSAKLLAEGAFQPNTFTAFGYNSLGGQDFLKAFSLIFFDARYQNTIDTVICFILGLALTIGFGRRLKAPFSLIFACAVLFIVINPQIVNSSSVYSGTLMVMGLIISIVQQQKTIYANTYLTTRRLISSSLPVGLFYGALTTLKANLIIFAALFFTIKFLGDIFFVKNKKAIILSNIAVLAVSFGCILPWLLSPSSKYIAELFSLLSPEGPVSSSSETSEALEVSGNTVWSFFSTADLFYGAALPDYLAVLALMIGVLLVALWSAAGKVRGLSNGTPATVAASILPIFISLAIMVGITDIPDTALRYNAPLMIAVLPVGLILVCGRIDNLPDPFALSSRGVLVGTALVIIGMFSHSFIDRLERIAYERHVVSFPVSERYRQSMKLALGAKGADMIEDAQAAIEEGTEVLAWVATPFLFDFSRNRFTIFESVDKKWVPDFPLNSDTETLWRFFRKQGFQYIVWQYSGFGVKGKSWYQGKRSEGIERLLYLRRTLPDLASKTQLAYNRNNILVMDIREFSKQQ